MHRPYQDGTKFILTSVVLGGIQTSTHFVVDVTPLRPVIKAFFESKLMMKRLFSK